jgi:aldehyde dehydrogenase (NAD+)
MKKGWPETAGGPDALGQTAAHQSGGWGRATAHQRTQVLYYAAENLAARAEIAARIARMTGGDGAGEVDLAVRRLLTSCCARPRR